MSDDEKRVAEELAKLPELPEMRDYKVSFREQASDRMLVDGDLTFEAESLAQAVQIAKQIRQAISSVQLCGEIVRLEVVDADL